MRAAIHVQSGNKQSSVSAEGSARRDPDHLSAPIVWTGAGGVQKRQKWLGAFAPTVAPASGSPATTVSRGQFGSLEEGTMCPACIESAAVMAAGAASTGGILAMCIGKFGKFLKASGFSLFQKTKEK